MEIEGCCSAIPEADNDTSDVSDRPAADYYPDYPEDRFRMGSAIQACVKVTPIAATDQRPSRWPTGDRTLEPTIQGNIRT